MIIRRSARLLGLCGLLLIAACASAGTPIVGPDPASTAPQTVKAVRGNISSVVTVDATLTPTPEFAIIASRTGVVTYGSTPRPGKRVTKSQTLARQGGQKLQAPVDGYFVRWIVPSGVKVHKSVPVAIMRYAGFAAAGSTSGAQAYRMTSAPISARVQILNGPGPTACTLLPVEAATPTATQSSFPVLCAIPPEIRAFSGLSAAIGITTAERRDVLVVPALAVAGNAQTGVVMKMVNGKAVATAVRIGATDGVNIEVQAGLSEGDAILANAQGLRANIQGTQQ